MNKRRTHTWFTINVNVELYVVGQELSQIGMLEIILLVYLPEPIATLIIARQVSQLIGLGPID